MSWFQDLASKTESLLNAVDKGAAQVLHSPVGSSGQSSVASSTSGREYRSSGAVGGCHDYYYNNSSDNIVTTAGAADDMSDETHSTHSIKTIGSSSSLSVNTGNGNGGGGNGNGGHTTASSSRGHTRTSSFESIGSRGSSKSSKTSNQTSSATGGDRPPMDDESLFEFLNNKGEDIPEESPLLAISVPSSATASSVGGGKVSAADSGSSSRSSPPAGAQSSPTPPSMSLSTREVREDFDGRIKSLTTEISSLNRRNIELETDCKRLQKRVHNWVQQLNASDNTIRELQSRESDLTANLDAKDSQIAVLKVRLQESDAELQQRLTQIDTLEALNESLRSSADFNTNTAQESLEDYRQRIRQLETDLSRERDDLRANQQQTMAQIGRLEDNQKSLVDEISILQRQIAVEKAGNAELEVRLKTSLKLNEDLDRDYQEFKTKASKTLADKDELIRALKSADGTGDGPDSGVDSPDDEVRRVLQSQCDAMVQEIQDLREKYDSVRRQYDRVNLEDMSALQTRLDALQDQLTAEQRVRTEAELELRQARDESRYFQDDLHQTKSSMESRIGDRDQEIEKLRKQLVSRRSAGGHDQEYEQRYRQLTDQLIQKQTLVESLTSERHSLGLQLERSEQRLRDAMNNSAKSAEGIHHSPSFTNLVNRSAGSVRPLVEDYPEDGNVTRRVKKAYGQIDAFSIRLGNFLRAYPSARAAFLVYILILHIWVAFVITYYEPEQHGPNFNKLPTDVTD